MDAIASLALLDRGVIAVARVVAAARRYDVERAVAAADAVPAPALAPGVWRISESPAGGFAPAGARDLRLSGDGAPRGVVGRRYPAAKPRAGRPTVVVVHGFNSGAPFVEERLWPIAKLNERGVDVVLFMLPDHGLRKTSTTLSSWPTPTNLAHTAIMVDTAVRELRSLVRALRHDGRTVSVWGMSLGAHIGAVCAGLDQTPFVAVTPLWSLASLFASHGVLDADDEATVERALGGRAPVSAPPPPRAMVIGALGDGITGLAQAQRLAAWADAEWHTIPGSHLAPAGLEAAFDAAVAHTVSPSKP